MASKTGTKPAPYVSAKTFERFLQRFVEAGGKLPARIDRSVLGGLSGSNQSAVLGALEFLGLIQPDGTVTESFRKLLKEAEPGEGVPPEHLSEVVLAAYKPVVGELDLSTTTGKMLEERFKEYGGVDGHTRVKAITFYLKLAKDAGVPVSPHIKLSRPQAQVKRKPRTDEEVTGKNAKNPNRDAGGGDGGAGDTTDPPGLALPTGLHPMIAGLIKSLPEPGSAMTESQRSDFETTFGMALKIAYKVAPPEAEPR